MPKRVEHVDPVPEFDRHFNRARFIDETTHGLYELLGKAGKDKAWLARRLGHAGRSAITKAFRGDNNFKLETLADISLALGRAVHVVWGADFKEVRFPRDEAAPNADQVSIFELANTHVESTENGQETNAETHTIGFVGPQGGWTYTSDAGRNETVSSSGPTVHMVRCSAILHQA